MNYARQIRAARHTKHHKKLGYDGNTINQPCIIAWLR
jgi:hypothetical protein